MSNVFTAESTDNRILGAKVIGYALNCLQWFTVIAITWSCSTLLMGIVAFIAMSILMAMVRFALGMLLAFKLDVSTLDSIGAGAARVASVFTRKQSVAA